MISVTILLDPLTGRLDLKVSPEHAVDPLLVLALFDQLERQILERRMGQVLASPSRIIPASGSVPKGNS